MHPIPLKIAVSVLLVSLTLSCTQSKKEPDTSAEADQGAAAEESAPVADNAAAQPARNPVSAPVTTADIERWEKGMAGEMKAVQEAATKLKSARTNEDSLNAMMGVQEMSTVEAGAAAAGMEQERYKFVRSNLSAVVGYLTPSLGGIDTTMLTQAHRDELRQGNEAQLQRMQQDVPADVVEAIRPRAVELRKKDLELVGARLKGAGMQ